jgi:hypothetical protein
MNVKYNRKEQIFQTRVPPTSEETLKYLKGFRPPNHAYILFEKQEFKIVGDGEYEYGTGLFTLNVEHRPEQQTKIDQYLRKGFKVLHYDNFPGVHQKSSVRMAKAKLYSGESQQNPWEELDVFLKASIENNPHWRSELAAKESKIAMLEQRLAEAEKRLKKSDKSDGKDKGQEAAQ